MKRKPFTIGLDAGTYTGVAVWDNRANRLADLFTSGFWDVFEWISANFSPDNAEVVIEALGSGALYARTPNGARAGRDRIASNVGSVRRETELLAEGLERAGFTVNRARPYGPKWSPETFRSLTGYTGRSSAHARDAVRIILQGRPVYSKTRGPKRGK